MPKSKKIIQIHLHRAIAIVGGAILTSIVGTVFAMLSILNTDHFTLVAVSQEVKKVPETYVRKDVYKTEYERICERLTLIEQDTKEILKTLGGK
jgi:hypothetical protein